MYILTDADSKSDLPIFPLLNPASTHDSMGFLQTFFRMKNLLPDAKVTNLLLDAAHDAMPYYEYCLESHISPFIDLNGNGTVQQDDITLDMVHQLDTTIGGLLFIHLQTISHSLNEIPETGYFLVFKVLMNFYGVLTRKNSRIDYYTLFPA